MRTILILSLLVLAGCKLQTEVREDAIHTELANVDGAVRVANVPDAVGHVELSIAPDSVHMEPNSIGHVEVAKGAMTVEREAVMMSGVIHPGAIQLSTQPGTVQIPISTTVSEGAVKVSLALTVAEGAIVIKGLEPGAVQTTISTPWWAWLIMGLLGLGWVITKFRRHAATRGTTRSMSDLLF